MLALAADAKKPVALKNLGGILGRDRDRLQALYYLRQFQVLFPSQNGIS
jgi:hypothetical protein